MERVQRSLVKAAPWNVPVLLSGESGVGKEIVAPELHRLSPLPSELVESELFGYEKGAFTGAFRSKPGKFEMARGPDPSAPEPESTTTPASPATLAAGRRGAPLLLADTRA